MSTDKTMYPGLGAIVHQQGVAFRVWAPHAQSVSVVGSFNNWDKNSHPMTLLGNGYWYTDIQSAKPGDEYRYHLKNGDHEFTRIDPCARQVTNSVGNGIIYDPDSFNWKGDSFKPIPFNKLVIYEMHIGSFFTSRKGKPGTFDDAVSHFHHLKKLGINAIEIMPVTEFAGDFSWGYNPAHLFAVESAYGGPDGYKRFIQAAHREGMAVIQDLVYNHFGPSDLATWQFDDWSENGNGGIYFFNDNRAVTPWGNTRPDYGREEVRNFIRDNAVFWFNEYHINGLRYDSTIYLRTVDGNEAHPIPEGWELMRSINSEVWAKKPDAILIAEDLRNNAALTRSDLQGGASFHAQWDANFVFPIRKAVTEINDAWRSMSQVADALNFKYNDDAFQRVIYSESHDEVANGKARVPQEIDPNNPASWFAQKRSCLAAALVFTAPGIPMLFQGQEFLQDRWFEDTVPLDWENNDDFRGIVRLYRDLIILRRNTEGVTKGLASQFINVFRIDDDQNIIAFHRWDKHEEGDDVVVVANFSAEARKDFTLGLPFRGLWKLRLNSDSKFYSRDFAGFFSSDTEGFAGAMDGLPYHGSINIAPYSVLIYSQDKQA